MKPTKAGRYVVEISEASIKDLEIYAAYYVTPEQVIAPVEPQQSDFTTGYTAALEDAKAVCHAIHNAYIDFPKPKNPHNPHVHVAAFGAFEVWKKICELPSKHDIRNEFKGGVG